MRPQTIDTTHTDWDTENLKSKPEVLLPIDPGPSRTRTNSIPTPYLPSSANFPPDLPQIAVRVPLEEEVGSFALNGLGLFLPPYTTYISKFVFYFLLFYVYVQCLSFRRKKAPPKSVCDFFLCLRGHFFHPNSLLLLLLLLLLVDDGSVHNFPKRWAFTVSSERDCALVMIEANRQQPSQHPFIGAYNRNSRKIFINQE